MHTWPRAMRKRNGLGFLAIMVDHMTSKCRLFRWRKLGVVMHIWPRAFKDKWFKISLGHGRLNSMCWPFWCMKLGMKYTCNQGPNATLDNNKNPLLINKKSKFFVLLLVTSLDVTYYDFARSLHIIQRQKLLGYGCLYSGSCALFDFWS